MHSIKNSIITNVIIYKIIYYMKQSINNSSSIGKEVSQYYFNIYNFNNYTINSDNSNETKNMFYYFINQLNINTNLNISIKYISLINTNKFFNKLNKKIYKLNQIYISSYFRGYYFNNLYLYSTNLNLSNTTSDFYFVLYDFNIQYLDFIYTNILNSISFIPKIKYLLNTYIDKYSINELTDTIPYKLVFLHKKKYYKNIINILLNFLFYDIFDENQLNNDEKYVFQLYNLINI